MTILCNCIGGCGSRFACDAEGGCRGREVLHPTVQTPVPTIPISTANANINMFDISTTLAQRGNSHGDFQANGSVMQHLKEVVRGERNWSQLPPYQREAIEMICHKLGRILCGNSNFIDHWHDIAGYATLVENILSKQQTTQV